MTVVLCILHAMSLSVTLTLQPTKVKHTMTRQPNDDRSVLGNLQEAKTVKQPQSGNGKSKTKKQAVALSAACGILFIGTHDAAYIYSALPHKHSHSTSSDTHHATHNRRGGGGGLGYLHI